MEEIKNIGINQEDQVIEMDINRLKGFINHPFKVTPDINMAELKESIDKYGILNPIIVRPVLDGYFEVISGHRRLFAAKQIGYRKVPVIIKNMSDADAVIAMVDSNIYREYISVSEKAKAYKMKYDVMKRVRGACSLNGYRPKGKRSVNILAEEYGESAKQIQRYLKITELIPDMLQLLDDDEISFSAAYELAYLKPDEQVEFMEAMEYTLASPSLGQAQRIKRLSQEKELTLDAMIDILSEVKRDDITRVSFKTELLRKYFPKSYTPEMMRREIIAILNTWMEQYLD